MFRWLQQLLINQTVDHPQSYTLLLYTIVLCYNHVSNMLTLDPIDSDSGIDDPVPSVVRGGTGSGVDADDVDGCTGAISTNDDPIESTMRNNTQTESQLLGLNTRGFGSVNSTVNCGPRLATHTTIRWMVSPCQSWDHDDSHEDDLYVW